MALFSNLTSCNPVSYTHLDVYKRQPMPYPLDLHMHSQYSGDGEFSPAQLAEQCQAAGITLMAVTDHNSTRAVDETQEAAQTLGIQCISGVELDCRFQGIDLHLLG